MVDTLLDCEKNFSIGTGRDSLGAALPVFGF
jgi:hypothetical protein